MKRKLLIVFLAIVSVVCCSLGLAACGDEGKECAHDQLSDWKFDAASHWRNCLNCDETSLEWAPHSFDAYEISCSVCDYNIYGEIYGYGEGVAVYNGMMFGKVEGKNAYELASVLDTSITDLVIPAQVNGLPVISQNRYILPDEVSLTSITFPNTFTEVIDEAFSGCETLKTVNFGNGITKIGARAFYNCTALETVNFGNALTEIEDWAFAGCENLTSLTMPNSLKTIKSRAFSGCSKVESISLNEGLTEIGEWAFYFNELLVSVTMPNSLKTIGASAFDTCKSLESVSLNNGLTEIGGGAFRMCLSLESVVVPDSVTTLGTYVFYDCESLTSLTIGKGVTEFSEGHLGVCKNLESLTIPFVGSSLAATEASAETCFGYIFGKNEFISSRATNQYYDEGQYVTYYLPSSLKNVTVTGGRILRGAFYNCHLENVTLPANITEIGAEAFINCDFSIITIPDSVTTIGEYAFNNCFQLKDVIIGSGLETVAQSAFLGCIEIENVYYKGTANEWNQISFANDLADPTQAVLSHDIPLYYYIENQADVPNDGGNYWHYDTDGVTPVEWKDIYGDITVSSLAGKTFVFYDMTCDGYDADTLAQTKAKNEGMTIVFGDNGDVTITQLTGSIVQTGTYTNEGGNIIITVTSMTMDGDPIDVGDGVIVNCTYDGEDLIMASQIPGEMIAYSYFSEQTAE